MRRAPQAVEVALCTLAAHTNVCASQIRASPCTAPPGNTFWSAPVQLDALGAAAVVLVPAAMAARDATTADANSAIVVSVTAVEVMLPLSFELQPSF